MGDMGSQPAEARLLMMQFESGTSLGHTLAASLYWTWECVCTTVSWV